VTPRPERAGRAPARFAHVDPSVPRGGRAPGGIAGALRLRALAAALAAAVPFAGAARAEAPAPKAAAARSGAEAPTPAAKRAPASGLAGDLAARARALVGPDQGVYVETADGTVLVSQAAARAVHPASVSKVPTTLALLRSLGPEHRFETRFAAAGPLADGVLQGDLVVEASGDPFLVDENALVVLLALRGLGLRRVAGDLVVRGPLLFDWKREAAAARLRLALEGQVPAAAWQAVRARAAAAGGSARAPGLAFGRAASKGSGPQRVLVTHRSQPLVPLVKALNGYSNNIFAPFSDAVGGVEAVQRIARESVPAALRDEIVLGDGAGASPRNRLSPRASVALLRALERELAADGAGLEDVLPVAGVDEGTLRHRLDGPGERGHVVAKTGTYGSYGACALAGALRTRRGPVYFAVLNRNVPIESARRRQDAFVRALLAAFDTEPWPYRRDDAPAFTRAEVRTASGASGAGAE
jgi:D-alanyl-D-alanine carboxypeptidase/D-alanyl-D-alanine-endopeptidase (penicillin-binding protein 4)